jgi:hypothetical protein
MTRPVGIILFLAVLMTGCTPQEVIPVRTLPTTWGDATHIADAPLTESPIIALTPQRIWWAWTDEKQAEVRHLAQLSTQTSPTILALSAWQPTHYRLLPALNNRTHWLWLDNQNAESTRPTLKLALVNPDLVAELGAKPLSVDVAHRFSAVSMKDAAMRVVWSEGDAGSVGLYTIAVDGRGRVPRRVLLRAEGDYPTLVSARDGTVWLYWLHDKRVWRGRLLGDTLEDVTSLMSMPTLNNDQWLQTFTASMDDNRTYLFWQVVDTRQRAQVWLTSGGAEPSTWTSVQRLGVGMNSTGNVETGFNSGNVPQARNGATWIEWATPLVGQFSTVPLVSTIGQDLLVIYLRNGEIIGAQPLASITMLYAPPNIISDPDRHLYVTWTQTKDAQTAELWYTSTTER